MEEKKKSVIKEIEKTMACSAMQKQVNLAL